MAKNPLQQFQIVEYGSVPVPFVGDIAFTNQALWMLIASGVVALVLAWASHRPKLVPSRMQSVAELTVDFIRALVRDTAGEEALKFLPLIFTLFLFIAGVNLIGMVPGSYTGTSQMVTTLTLSVSVFALVIGLGFYAQGLGFLKLFYPAGTPWWLAPVVVILELISFFARPLTLALRLAANMIAGHVLLKVFAGFVIMLMVSLPPLALVPLAVNVALTGLEVLVALLQAYIFTILTCVYLHDALHGH